MDEIQWLLFLAQLPTSPSALRVNVWRKLKDAGTTSLQNGVWILPRNEQTTQFLERLLAYIKQNNATGQVFVLQAQNQTVQDGIIARFRSDRKQEYDEFLEQCEEFLAELDKEILRYKFTFAELEENEQGFKRLKDWLAKINRRDFFKNEQSQIAYTAFQRCEGKLREYTRQVYSAEGFELQQPMHFSPAPVNKRGNDPDDLER